jgi:4-aminobutyrate aminotransferase-like enzyme
VIGAYQCVEFVEDRDTKAPARGLAEEISNRMVELGVVSISEPAFSYIRPTPALNMPPALFSVGCDLVEQAVDEVSRMHGKGIA